MNVKGEQSINRLLVVLVVVLLAVVVGQSMVMMKLHKPTPDPLDKVTQMGRDDPADAGDYFQWSPVLPAIPYRDPATNAGAWDPLDEFRNIRQQMDQLFNDSLGRFRMSPDFDSSWGGLPFAPSMDLEETDGKYVIRMDLPGADKSDISVNVRDRTLTVSGTIEEMFEKNEKNQLRRERRSGQFNRTVTLPGPVNPDEMDAEYQDGVLVVTVPKSEQTDASRTIEVR